MAPLASWELFCLKWVIYHCYGRDVQKKPQKVERAITSGEKNQKPMTDIGGGWYLKKCERGLPLLKREKLIKKAQEREDLIKKKLYVK